MKLITSIILFLFSININCLSQDAQSYFNSSANYYVQGKNAQAKQSIIDGIKKYPNDAKLRALNEKLKEEKREEEKKKEEKKEQEKKEQEKKKDQQNKNQQDQQKKEQEKKEQEKKEQEKKEQEKKDQQGKKGEEEEKKKEEQEKKEQSQEQKDEQQKKEDQKPSPQVAERLKQMNMSEEKAKMILEAMKNQEVQYLQQNKRKATKPKDKGKPDW